MKHLPGNPRNRHCGRSCALDASELKIASKNAARAPVFPYADLAWSAHVISNLPTHSAKNGERGGKIQLTAE
nr:hypothetical protein Hi04_10k_c5016_00036 [uncultured bacterium]